MPDEEHRRAFDDVVCGIDEAGRGPWAGPVVAAAVILPARGIPPGLADSKTLTKKRREALAPLILAACDVGVGCASVAEIDALNILNATLLAMRRAVDALAQRPDLALVDGNRAPDLEQAVECIIKGDVKVPAISAASIVAKVTRDRQMRALAARHPGYGWDRNAGYGTVEHRAGLAEHGVTRHHRRSFAPIRALCG
jgi:ribonuclease HII